MRIRRLRNKLLLGAVAMNITVALLTMLVVFWVTSQQYLDQSNDHLGKAVEIINDSLAESRDFQLAASRQLATQKDIGSTIWYLAKYARSGIDPDMLFVTYQQLIKDTSRVVRVAKLSRVAIYDSTGGLISFASSDGRSELAGFVEHRAPSRFKVISLREGEELNRKNLRTVRSVGNLGLAYEGRLPKRESARYVLADGMLAIESQIPIMSEVLDPRTGDMAIRQVGLVVTTRPLDQSFVERLSKLTDTRINIFTPQGLGSRNIPGYRQPVRADAVRSATATSLGEITVEGEDFYQLLLPLYNGEEHVGTIATLQSKAVVTRNTREMLQVLALIALGSLLLISPMAWYFATSISRPLTVLSRIFRGVARGQQGDQLRELEEEKMRDDELGDLTQSFIAMDAAITEKIREVREINASLEHTVEERTAALSASERESRTLLENSPDTIARYDHECRRTYVNPAFAATAQGGAAALLGKKPTQNPGGQNSSIYEAKIKEVFATGADAQFELKWQDKDGRETCSHIRLTAERAPSGKVISVLGVGRDITELNEYRIELKRKELAKSRFLAAAGHDLRQPLAAANLFINALRFSGPSPEQDRLIQRLESAMSNFNELLDALLNISKLDSGAIKPNIVQIEVIEIFDWLEQSFAAMAGEKKIAFRFHFSMKAGWVIRSDLDLIKSALMNLVSNALKFTPAGAILISARRRGSELLFQVWDTGIGMPEEYLPHIFDEFYQVDNPQRDRTKGIGLGLSIAKRAISLLGGEVSCRSRVGHGTVFEFRVPIANAAHVPSHSADAVVSPEDADLSAFVRGKRFVVLEDDALVADALSGVLEAMGAEVRCFHDPDEALAHSQGMDADCYIADYMLGGTLNGIQFLNRLRRELGRPINAVLLTGDTSPAFIRETTDFNWPVLHKPVNITRLISSLGAQNLQAAGLQ